MDEICRKNINTRWISIPTGQEHFSFHNKNAFEENLFKCEDERYELDQFIFRTESTIKTLEALNLEI